jgi:hypothetical protein
MPNVKAKEQKAVSGSRLQAGNTFFARNLEPEL